MSICLSRDSHFLTVDVKNVAAALLGVRIVAAEEIKRGANSRVYRVNCSNAKSYLTKFYFRHVHDARDRLGVEFSSLKFLWQNGVRCIPQPLAMDNDLACAVYEFVEAEEISWRELSCYDMDSAVEFLRKLKSLKNKAQEENFSFASEAFFSVSGVIGNIQSRLERLLAIRECDEQDRVLFQYLQRDFISFFEELIEWGKRKSVLFHIPFEEEISSDDRTLSPSDFGFHNALRGKNGKVIFLDFEYFGWDDPAKMISDFLLHPAMEIPVALKKHFMRRMMKVFSENERLKYRIKILHPFFGLKWCLIFLNEFVPEYFQRRHFAGHTVFDRKEICLGQLDKARKMLADIQKTYQEFPYDG